MITFLIIYISICIVLCLLTFFMLYGDPKTEIIGVVSFWTLILIISITLIYVFFASIINFL